MSRKIYTYLRKHGIKAHYDGAGKRTGGNCGNLVAEVDGKGPAIMFIAHIDTVEDGKAPINPVIRNGTVYSDGKTVLGADNKAAVAALMSALLEIKGLDKRPRVIAAFTVSEESGVMGASFLRPQARPSHVFVIDGSSRVGTFISSALGDTSFQLKFIGKSVHTAYAERGINAMKAAGIMIARQRLGKYGDERYVNIGGVISDGKDNIVPGSVSLIGEARALSKPKMEGLMREIEKNAKEACRMTGCSYKLYINKRDSVPPYSARLDKKTIRMARSASRLSGLKFGLVRVKGTMETNVLQARYKSVIGISRGGKMPHSKEESVSEKDMLGLRAMIISIAKTAVE